MTEMHLYNLKVDFDEQQQCVTTDANTEVSLIMTVALLQKKKNFVLSVEKKCELFVVNIFFVHFLLHFYFYFILFFFF